MGIKQNLDLEVDVNPYDPPETDVFVLRGKEDSLRQDVPSLKVAWYRMAFFCCITGAVYAVLVVCDAGSVWLLLLGILATAGAAASTVVFIISLIKHIFDKKESAS